MADLTTVADLGTAAGTLVLAVATFASVRSGERSTRIAQEALLAGMRPLIMPSRLQDPPEKIGFVDGHWLHVDGGHGVVDATDGGVYLGMALRNVGTGLAVLHGWLAYPDRSLDRPRPEPDDFRRLTRDLYIAPGDTGFWQGAVRDAGDPLSAGLRAAMAEGEPVTVDLLYGDHQGGQRVISRFALLPSERGGRLLASSRHWNVDRADPR